MPAKSLAFAHMRQALLALVCDIPHCKVAVVGDVAAALIIPPRHVAFMLSGLSDDDDAVVPWYRVMPSGGKFPAPAKRSVRYTKQLKLLTLEGIALAADIIVIDLADCLADLPYTHVTTFWADEGKGSRHCQSPLS
jgi:methylated-DNA-protein-cysteine methyltransferase related protein